MNEEIFFHYQESAKYAQLYCWYQGSKFSFHKGKTSKVEAERCSYLSNYHLQELGKRVRALIVPK